MKSLMEAVRLASKYGPAGLAGLMAEDRWRDGLDQEVVEAARRGDEAGVRKLLGLERLGPQIGDVMADGTVYAGISPDTNKPMFAAAADAPGAYDHYEAEKYAKRFEGHGHKDFRVPTKNELSALFNNRTAIGGFNVTGSNPAGWYWSSLRHNISYSAWAQRFSDGNQNYAFRLKFSSLRLVR